MVGEYIYLFAVRVFCFVVFARGFAFAAHYLLTQPWGVVWPEGGAIAAKLKVVDIEFNWYNGDCGRNYYINCSQSCCEKPITIIHILYNGSLQCQSRGPRWYHLVQ